MAHDFHGSRTPRSRPFRRPASADEAKPRGWRARLQSIVTPIGGTVSGTGRVLSLVWGASRPLTLILGTVTILAGLIPAVQAYTAKLLINAVVNAIIIHTRHLPDQMVLHVPLVWGTITT